LTRSSWCTGCSENLVGETLGHLLAAAWMPRVLVALYRAIAGRWFTRSAPRCGVLDELLRRDLVCPT
jgi:hypothetical protein